VKQYIVFNKKQKQKIMSLFILITIHYVVQTITHTM